MQRRHFLKLSASGTAALLLHQRMTYAVGVHSLVHMPDEVWAHTGDRWFRLTGSGDGRFAVRKGRRSNPCRQGRCPRGYPFEHPGLGAQRHTPAMQGIHPIDPAATMRWGISGSGRMGDQAWKPLDPEVKNPWYVLLHDRSGTACFGVKTGCNAFCWWSVNTKGTELTLDTLSGGVGVSLGAHAASGRYHQHQEHRRGKCFFHDAPFLQK